MVRAGDGRFAPLPTANRASPSNFFSPSLSRCRPAVSRHRARPPPPRRQREALRARAASAWRRAGGRRTRAFACAVSGRRRCVGIDWVRTRQRHPRHRCSGRSTPPVRLFDIGCSGMPSTRSSVRLRSSSPSTAAAPSSRSSLIVRHLASSLSTPAAPFDGLPARHHPTPAAAE